MRLDRLLEAASGRSFVCITLGAALFSLARSSRAVGLELLPEGGPRSVSRGGAVLAKPEDPMSVTLNPAGLAFLHGNQILVGFELPLTHLCVDPHGYYGWGVNNQPATPTEFGDQNALDNPTNPTIGATYATTPLDKVCNSAPTAPLPQLAWAGKVTDNLAIAAGFVAPVETPGLQFGGADGTVQTAYGPRPTPTRYTLVKQAATDALDPTAAIAYRIVPELAVGLTAQVLMVRAQATAVQNELSGTQPSNDWLATVTTQDFFVPNLTFSAHAKPIPAMDLTGAFQWSDDLRGSGDVVYQTNTYFVGNKSGPVPYTNPPVKISTVTVRQPWKLAGGVRFHGDLSRAGAIGDSMDSELWDVEADVDYTFYKRSGRTTVNVGHDVTVFRKTADGSGSTNEANVAALDIERHLKDVYSLRLGGSYSVVPRVLMLNLGGFYESRGVDPAYADIDTFAFRRFGVGVGGVLRLGNFDLMAGYGHIASETIDLAPPNGDGAQLVGSSFASTKRTGGVVLPDPTAPSGSNATATAAKEAQPAVQTGSANPVVNSGRYTASFDVISLALGYHF